MDNTIYSKMSAYCSTAERCRADVEEKLRKADVVGDAASEIIARLEEEGYINEARYACAFASDRFSFSHWGKMKIKYALRSKQIGESCITKALEAIDPDEYERVKSEVMQTKIKSAKCDMNNIKDRAKVLRFMASRGFMIALLMAFNICLVKAAGYIEGVAPQYAGERLTLCYEMDGITHATTLLDSCTVDSIGRFRFETDIDMTRRCEIDLGYYKGYIYVEPYKTYKVNLPPRRRPTEQELLNPYFKQMELLLSLINPPADDLNLRITAFDDSFDVAFNRIIKSEITPERIETEYFALEEKFGDNSQFFTTYRYCCYAILINLYEPTQPNTAIDAFFIDEPVAYNNPAYWEAFSVLFDHYKNVEALAVNKPLQELVILHHTLTGEMSESWIGRIETAENKAIAARIEETLDTAAKGSYIGTTTITNIDGKTIDLKDFDTPQIYIIFAKSMLSKSVSDLEYAMARNEKWKGKCTVLVVFMDNDATNVYKITQKFKSRDNILFGTENRDFVKEFGIKHAPAYFRINSDGKILESPAASPENFEL